MGGSKAVMVSAAVAVAATCCSPAMGGDGGGGFSVGMWVWAAKDWPAEGEPRARLLAEMFGRIRDLGCDTVVIGAGASPDRLDLMDAAHRAGLRVVISCGAVHTWVQTGRMDNRPAEAKDVVDPEVARFRDHPALSMYFINDVPAPGHAERLAQATARFRELDPDHPTYVPYNYMAGTIWQQVRTPVITWDNFPVVHAAPPGTLVNDSYDVGSSHAQALREIARATPGARRNALIQCWGYEPDQGRRQRPPTLADVRQQTFVAMAAGWTDGFVLYHYHSRVDRPGPGGTRFSIFNLDGTLRVGPEDDMKAFIARARRIGQALAGGETVEVRGVKPAWPLQAAGFRNAGREYLMVLSNDVLQKRTQTLDAAAINGAPAASLTDVATGRQFSREGKALPLTVDLAPGDAALFEIARPAP